VEYIRICKDDPTEIICTTPAFMPELHVIQTSNLEGAFSATLNILALCAYPYVWFLIRIATARAIERYKDCIDYSRTNEK